MKKPVVDIEKLRAEGKQWVEDMMAAPPETRKKMRDWIDETGIITKMSELNELLQKILDEDKRKRSENE